MLYAPQFIMAEFFDDDEILRLRHIQRDVVGAKDFEEGGKPKSMIETIEVINVTFEIRRDPNRTAPFLDEDTRKLLQTLVNFRGHTLAEGGRPESEEDMDTQADRDSEYDSDECVLSEYGEPPSDEGEPDSDEDETYEVTDRVEASEDEDERHEVEDRDEAPEDEVEGRDEAPEDEPPEDEAPEVEDRDEAPEVKDSENCEEETAMDSGSSQGGASGDEADLIDCPPLGHRGSKVRRRLFEDDVPPPRECVIDMDDLCDSLQNVTLGTEYVEPPKRRNMDFEDLCEFLQVTRQGARPKRSISDNSEDYADEDRMPSKKRYFYKDSDSDSDA